MARIYLVRHGKAATTWDDRNLDPGLNDVGRAQAEARAIEFAGKGPFSLVTSPLRRTRETVAPLERQWKTVAQVDPRVGEISAPSNTSTQRVEWLKDVLARRWHELGQPLELWRNQVLQALLEITRDTVVVSHFVAINVAVGYASGDDRVTCFRPDNCSCTVLDIQGSRLHIIELGAEGTGRIL
ncbi:MAG TPA: histidine phosphatase family protein [Candidatus Angelobacter sp.]|nr:histidine phosphatase family protein [Candidatus Angelobacter sp.]